MTDVADDMKLGLDGGIAGALTVRLAGAFRASGKELYLVGGAVRDRLLGVVDVDLDFATSALPEETVEILESLAIGSVYRVGEKFGTIGLRVDDRLIEITTYRAQEVYPPGSRKPAVQFGTTLLQDLSRRDFTVNAVALDPMSGEIIDPFGGRADLGHRIIRAVGDPGERFQEDPLRILRAVRLASRLQFEIEGATRSALSESAATLASISRERIRDEYSRMLEGPQPVTALGLLRDLDGLFEFTVPQLRELTRMPDHGPRHPLSLWDHTMRVVAGVGPELVIRWAALLHDIAKPATRTHEPNGRPRFFHHEEVGARVAREILTGLRYSNQIVEDVALLIESHMQLHSYSPQWSDGAIRRLILRLGPLMGSAIELARADAQGHVVRGEASSVLKFDDLERRMESLDESTKRVESPLSGDDLMERYGRGPGPWIRGIKQTLLDEVVEGRLSPEDREGAWRIADQLVEALT